MPLRLILLLLFFCNSLYAAKPREFFLSVDPSLRQEDGLNITGFNIGINGQPVKNARNEVGYFTHYPAFDTIYYGTGTDTYKIITRFVPGKHYVVTLSCCAMFDFMEKEKSVLLDTLYRQTGNNYDLMDSIRMHYHETARVQVTAKNLVPNDSVFVYYGDFNGPPTGHLLRNNKKTATLSAFYGYYSSGISSIHIARFAKGEVKPAGVKNNVYEGYPDIENNKGLVSVRCRFFHNEKILATYDAKTNNMVLKIIN